MKMQKQTALRLAYITFFIWSALITLFIPFVFTQEECEFRIYSYKNDTAPPQITKQNDYCHEKYFVRAFMEFPLQNNSAQMRYKEVEPDPVQQFRCVSNQPCLVVVRGIGLTKEDVLLVLPKNQTECPPDPFVGETISNTDVHAGHTSQSSIPVDVSIIIKGESAWTHPKQHLSYVLFRLPDRYVLKSGQHSLCYSTARTVSYPSPVVVESVPVEAFHYPIGQLDVSARDVFRCTFEETGSSWIYDERDFTQPMLLPCGFHNVRDQYTIDLLWELGHKSTETEGTGPDGDVTKKLNGEGHYLVMDSPGYSVGATATVMSPPIPLPGNYRGYCVSFYYHMYGEDVSSLRVYIRQFPHLLEQVHEQNHNHYSTYSNLTEEEFRLDGETFVNNTDWGSPRWVAVGNKGNMWHQGGFDIKTTDFSVIQVILEGVAGKSEKADIAIDDIRISSGNCPASVHQNYPKTLVGDYSSVGEHISSMICGEVRLNTGSNAGDKSWYVDGAVSCGGRGYSIDMLNNSAWLPCCVPHLGKYNLILEDSKGDGWTGSSLEFRFFNQHFVFNDHNDPFQVTGYSKEYAFVIGTVEIVDVKKPVDAFPSFTITVRVSLISSYIWCGIVKAKSSGESLSVNLGPHTLKKYGIRSARPTSVPNELVRITFPSDIIVENSQYDVYCYSEDSAPISEKNDDKNDTSAVERAKQEILASRFRISTDITPPNIVIKSVTSKFHSIQVEFDVDESSTVWCLAEPSVSAPVVPKNINDTSSSEPILFNSTLFHTIMNNGNENSNGAMDLRTKWAYQRIKQRGTELTVFGDSSSTRSVSTQNIVLSDLTANTLYNVFCYAEDMALPSPNSMSLQAVSETLGTVKTEAKVPKVIIVRHVTLYQGFQLFIRADAPGRVWCAAAQEHYALPTTEDVIKAGVSADIQDPSQLASMLIYGVEQNTKYLIYCVGGLINDSGSVKATTTRYDMDDSKLVVTSYGKYCEIDISEPVIRTVSELTPFHPLTPDEELSVRNYIMGVAELDLKGVYRITLLPNKTEIYNYYDENGPKPKRYARVRAGRCVGSVGYYEQFRVGPLETPDAMTYERLGRPTATECGGYTPQGVFGRLLSETDSITANDLKEKFDEFLNRSFGYVLGADECKETFFYVRERNETSNGFKTNCVELGPVFLEERNKMNNNKTTGDDDYASDSFVAGYLWIGLRTPEGSRLPLYFIHHLTSPDISKRAQEKPLEFAQRLLHEHQLLPHGMESQGPLNHWLRSLYGSKTEIWMYGRKFSGLRELLDYAAVEKNLNQKTYMDWQRSLHENKQRMLSSESRRNKRENERNKNKNNSNKKQNNIKPASGITSPISNPHAATNPRLNDMFVDLYGPTPMAPPNSPINYSGSFWGEDWGFPPLTYPSTQFTPVYSSLGPQQSPPLPNTRPSPRYLQTEATTETSANNLKKKCTATFTPSPNKPNDQQIENGYSMQPRALLPQPFAGAAGTAGPLPSRLNRRGDLEYKAVPEHVEPQGKRFTVEASEDLEAFTIKYLGWSMTVTNDRDTALNVYNLRFLNKRVAFEMGLMEALAHYSISERNWFFLDSWYGGLGAAARRVHKGIECPKTGVSLFFDGSLCVFEQDMARPIRSHWKSGEIRDGAPHAALVLRQMLTVSNYDYITDYRFHSTGMFEGNVAFTGELYAGIEVPWFSTRQQDYGVQVTGAMRFAALHNHMAVWKIDFDVGEGNSWKKNSVMLTEVIADPQRNGANKLRRWFPNTESEAAFFRNDTRALVYEVVNEETRVFGNVGGYRVIPGPGVNPLHHQFELYMGPAAWAKYRAATTVRKYNELDSTLPRDNKYASQPAVSLDRYVLDNETIRNSDVVTWISDGIFHIPVIEDMPLTIPIGNTLGWLVKPANLFYEDPSMDLWNSMGGGVQDPGTCAVMRLGIGEVEPSLDGTWEKVIMPSFNTSEAVQ